jgi:hypothetical protein
MEAYDRLHPNNANDYDSANGSNFENLKSSDRGYNIVFRKVLRKNGKLKNAKVEFYTSDGTGCLIRDAITGACYSERCGSFGENIFFKVGLSTGECKSKNGSNTLFFLSPEQYESHLHVAVSQSIKNSWLNKKNTFLVTRKTEKR